MGHLFDDTVIRELDTICNVILDSLPSQDISAMMGHEVEVDRVRKISCLEIDSVVHARPVICCGIVFGQALI